MSEGGELRGYTGPTDEGWYECNRCTSKMQGPREFVLQHEAWHVQQDMDAMPKCTACQKHMKPAIGEIVASGTDERGAFVVEHSESWQCVNESCDMFEVEVPRPDESDGA